MVAGDRIRCHLRSNEMNALNIGKKEIPRTFGLEGWLRCRLSLVGLNDLEQTDMI